MLSEGVGVNSLTLSLRYSWLFRAVLVVLHFVPLAAVFFGSVSVQIALLVGVSALVSAGLLLRHAAKMSSFRLELFDSGEAFLLRSDRSDPVCVLEISVDMGWLIVVSWQDLGTSLYGRAALTCDAFSPEVWRALRVWLKWKVRRSSV